MSEQPIELAPIEYELVAIVIDEGENPIVRTEVCVGFECAEWHGKQHLAPKLVVSDKGFRICPKCKASYGAAMTQMEEIVELRQQLTETTEKLNKLTSAFNQLVTERDALARFKAWVHEFLNQHGVPADPDPAGNAQHGCRISGRMQWVFDRLYTRPFYKLRYEFIVNALHELREKHPQGSAGGGLMGHVMSRVKEAQEAADAGRTVTDEPASLPPVRIPRHWIMVRRWTNAELDSMEASEVSKASGFSNKAGLHLKYVTDAELAKLGIEHDNGPAWP